MFHIVTHITGVIDFLGSLSRLGLLFRQDFSPLSALFGLERIISRCSERFYAAFKENIFRSVEGHCGGQLFGIVLVGESDFCAVFFSCGDF